MMIAYSPKWNYPKEHAVDRITLSFQVINQHFSRMKTHLATGGSTGNAILGLACRSARFWIGKVGDDEYGAFTEEFRLKRHRREVTDL